MAELERNSEGGVSDAGELWTILHMILWSAEYLTEKGVEAGRLDAEWLLSAALGVDRLQLYLQYDRPLSSEEREAFKPLLRRRARREPLQYIIGRAAFRQLELKTDPRVLIPRTETEVLVQEVLDWASAAVGGAGRVGDGGVGGVWDMGTGTGAVALSLAAEGAWRVVATDVSPEALSVAADNAERHGLERTRRVPAGLAVRAVGGGGTIQHHRVESAVHSGERKGGAPARGSRLGASRGLIRGGGRLGRDSAAGRRSTGAPGVRRLAGARMWPRAGRTCCRRCERDQCIRRSPDPPGPDRSPAGCDGRARARVSKKTAHCTPSTAFK